MASSQRHDLIASAIVKRVLDNKKPHSPFLSGDLKCRFNFMCGTGAHNVYLSFDHACCFLQLAQLESGRGVHRVDQHTYRRSSRNKLVQKLQTLGLQFRPEKTHARDVALRPINACDEASHDWIAGADKDNRNLGGCRLGHRCSRGICGDHSHFATYKIGSHCLKVVVLTPGPSVIQRDVSTLDVTGFAESMEESGHVRAVSFWRSAIEESDHRHCRLLRTRSDWRRHHCSTQKGDQVAPSHVPPPRRPCAI